MIRKGRLQARCVAVQLGGRSKRHMWRLSDGRTAPVVLVGADRAVDASHYELGAIFDDAKLPRRRPR